MKADELRLLPGEFQGEANLPLSPPKGAVLT